MPKTRDRCASHASQLFSRSPSSSGRRTPPPPPGPPRRQGCTDSCSAPTSRRRRASRAHRRSMESGARRAALRVPARAEQHVPRQLRRLRRPQHLDARRSTRRDASVDHRQPHSLYARVRAITPAGATPWSANYGFDMVAPAAPSPLPSYPGVIRWTPLEGVRHLRGLVRRHPEVRRRRDRTPSTSASSTRSTSRRTGRARSAGASARSAPTSSSAAPPGPAATTRPRRPVRAVELRLQLDQSGVRRRTDQARRHRLRRLLQRRRKHARPQADAGVRLGRATSRSRARPPSCTASTCSRTSSA